MNKQFPGNRLPGNSSDDFNYLGIQPDVTFAAPDDDNLPPLPLEPMLPGVADRHDPFPVVSPMDHTPSGNYRWNHITSVSPLNPISPSGWAAIQNYHINPYLGVRCINMHTAITF